MILLTKLENDVRSEASARNAEVLLTVINKAKLQKAKPRKPTIWSHPEWNHSESSYDGMEYDFKVYSVRELLNFPVGTVFEHKLFGPCEIGDCHGWQCMIFTKPGAIGWCKIDEQPVISLRSEVLGGAMQLVWMPPSAHDGHIYKDIFFKVRTNFELTNLPVLSRLYHADYGLGTVTLDARSGGTYVLLDGCGQAFSFDPKKWEVPVKIINRG